MAGHMSGSVNGNGTGKNRLINETSPYLLQHAKNPVDWQPWDDKALEEARKRNLPILLSIGYSSCHWCHVMERESFEDPAIAALMNESYVNIKVDREERPDLDELYMKATMALNRGQGGWPMTVFLAPDTLQPFFAGTYFPPREQQGRVGFDTVLNRIAKMWQEDREALLKQGAVLSEHLERSLQIGKAEEVGVGEIHRAVDLLKRLYDEHNGGFGMSPKFPPYGALELLMRFYRRTGDQDALQMAVKTLDRMASGGIWDHLEGGFSRYSVDAQWLVPHFEKMLYDNALLAKCYLWGYQLTGNHFYRLIAESIFDYVLRRLKSEKEAGFYSSQDADSEGEEGKYYVWTLDDLDGVLTNPEIRVTAALMGITGKGNWEGKSVLHSARSLEEVASEANLSLEDAKGLFLSAKTKMLQARGKRVAPAVDDKVLTSWNALMIDAFAEGARVLGVPAYARIAREGADFILEKLIDKSGKLLRSYRQGKAHIPGILEDYAYLANALISLYEVLGKQHYLTKAHELGKNILELFLDEKSGAFFSTGKGHEKLFLRFKDGVDGATPNPNTSAAEALLRLSYHLDDDKLKEAGKRALKAHGEQVKKNPYSYLKALCLADFITEEPIEITLQSEDPDSLSAFLKVAAQLFLPNHIIHHREGKENAVMVCHRNRCQLPLTHPEDLKLIIKNVLETARTGLLIEGQATPSGTASFADKHGKKGFVPLGTTGLWTSRIGFGGYRITDDIPHHREALKHAIEKGCNLIDTSTNYSEGKSERCIGSVIRELSDENKIRREELIIVSKIGYIQGRSLAHAMDREKNRQPIPGIVKVSTDCWHCIHPEFLQSELDKALSRLQLSSLDILLLHNPEYFLAMQKKAENEVQLNHFRDELYKRLQMAFVFLEEAVKSGKIHWYGVSSNTITGPENGVHTTSLSRMLAVAQAAGGKNHHFRIIQFPFNLYESGASTERNHDGRTLLEVARSHGIATLANRPLNAIANNEMLRLADFPTSHEPIDFSMQIAKLKDLEGQWKDVFAKHVQIGEGGEPAETFFRFADIIEQLHGKLKSVDQWLQIRDFQILPYFHKLVTGLSRYFIGELLVRWNDWKNSYIAVLDILFQDLLREGCLASQKRSNKIHHAIEPLLPPDKRKESLSRKALWALASTKGVTVVLNGMRTENYVEDSLPVMQWDLLKDTQIIFDTVKKLGV